MADQPQLASAAPGSEGYERLIASFILFVANAAKELYPDTLSLPRPMLVNIHHSFFIPIRALTRRTAALH